MSAASWNEPVVPSTARNRAAAYLAQEMERLAERPEETVLWSDVTDSLRELVFALRRRFGFEPARTVS